MQNHTPLICHSEFAENPMGGDTLGAAAIDIGVLWLLGVPLTVLVGMLLHLPFTTVVLMTCLEEVVKVGVSLLRVRKYKWAKQLV